jgi:hypothetical protein
VRWVAGGTLLVLSVFVIFIVAIASGWADSPVPAWFVAWSLLALVGFFACVARGVWVTVR